MQGEHWFYVALGCFGMLFYMVGLPCAIVLILRHIQRNSLHCNIDTMVAFGGLYMKYEAHATWYEVIQVLKRTVFALIIVMLDSNPNLQVHLIFGI